MNANELADELDSISYDCTLEEWRASPVGNAAAMLRQQQAEIEALKQIIDANNLSQNIGQFVKPAKYSDAWWKEVDEFNKQLKAQENGN